MIDQIQQQEEWQQLGGEWCEHDPKITVETANGSKQKIFVTLAALGMDHKDNLKAAEIDVRPSDQGRKVRVQMSVKIPGDGFPVKVTISQKPKGGGTIYAEDQEGKAGKVLRFDFVI